MDIAVLFFGKSAFSRERAHQMEEAISKENNIFLFEMKENNYSTMDRIFFELRTVRELFQRKLDVVHLHDHSLVLPFFIKSFRNRGIVVVYDTGNIHTETVKVTGNSGIVVFLVKLTEKLTIKNADFIISRGIFLKNVIEEIRGNNTGVFYIPDPVNVITFKVIEQKQARVVVGLPKEKFLIGYVANFVKIKVRNKFLPRGWELVEVLSKFKEKGIHDLCVTFMGSGSGLDELRKFASEKGVDSYCIFTGFIPVEKYAYFLKAIDVGFMEDYDTIQYKTSIGAKVQEYMAAGKIVVTGNNPERNYLLNCSQGTKFFFTPMKLESNDEISNLIEQIFSIMLYAYEHLDEIKAIGLNNERRSFQLFDHQVVGRSLRDFYDKI